MLPKAGSGSSTRTVYISFLTWWYMRTPGLRNATGDAPCRTSTMPGDHQRSDATRTSP
jgi:hypothetical protein